MGARFLDLFCGGGGVGIEALSRDARDCCMVDRSSAALATVRENLGAVGAEADLRRLDLRVAGWGHKLARRAPFDLIYLDPPYDWPEYEETLVQAAELLSPGGELALEHASDSAVSISGSLRVARTRQYGGTELHWLVLAAPES